MKKILSVMLIMHTILICNAAESLPYKLYSDVANSISTASGNIMLYFGQGYWVKTMGGKKVIINFEENQLATLKFSYAGGQIQEGSRLSFSPGIHVWVKGAGGGLSLQIDTLWFDENGKYKAWKVRYDNPGTNNPNDVSNIQDALRLNDRSEHLFGAKLLKNFSDAKKCDINGNPVANNRPVLYEVKIKKPNEAEAGLAVSFIPNSLVHFSSKVSNGTFDNKISLNTGNFEIRYLDYNVMQKEIECEISHFDVNIQSGVMQCSGLLLNITAGSRLLFNRLKIIKNENESSVSAENGTLNMQVGSGTKVNLFNTSRYPSQFVFENGEITLFDFAYSTTADSKTVFQIGGGSSLKVATRSGSLALCDNNGYLSMSNGRLESMLSGTWNSASQDPDVHLDISLLQVSLDGGYFPFAGQNILGIKSGFIKSESMRFDGLNFSSAVGEIKDLNIVMSDETQLSIPGGMQFQIKENGVINGAIPNEPLRFDTHNKYVSGVFRFNFQFDEFSNATNNVIKLHDGSVNMKLTVLNLDTIKGSIKKIDGNAAILAEAMAFNCHIELYGGHLLYVRGNDPEFDSKMKIQLNTGNQISLTTPFEKQDDHDIRFFPINLLLGLNVPVISQETSINLKGAVVNVDEIIVNPQFALIIPIGKGEHQDKDNENSATGGEHGPEWSRNCQEVFYAHSGLPPCDMHIYVKPQPVIINSTMKLGISNNTISFNFTNLSFKDPFVNPGSWDKDGCDLGFIGGVLGAIGGTLLAGPAGGIAGAAAGVAAGMRAETLVEDRINIAIAKAATKVNINKQWRFN